MRDEIKYCGECRYFEGGFDIIGFCSLLGEIVSGEDKACEHFVSKEAMRDAE